MKLELIRESLLRDSHPVFSGHWVVLGRWFLVIGTHRGATDPNPGFSTFSRDEHCVATVQGIAIWRSPRNVEGMFFMMQFPSCHLGYGLPFPVQTEIYLDQGLAQPGCSHLESQQTGNAPSPASPEGLQLRGADRESFQRPWSCLSVEVGTWGTGHLMIFGVFSSHS